MPSAAHDIDAIGATQPWPGRALSLALWALLAVHFALNLAHDATYYLDLHAYVAGRAELPYQYRILMTPVMGWLADVAADADARGALTHLPAYLASSQALAYLVVNAAGFFLALVLFERILLRLFPAPALRFWGMALFVAVAYAFFVLNPNLAFILPYDLPALAFTQACLLLFLSGRWRALALVFAVATINRETSFLIGLFIGMELLAADAFRRRQLIGLVATLAAIWVAVKLVLFLAVSGSGAGSVAMSKLSYNGLTLLKPWQWPTLLPLAAPLVVCIPRALAGRDPMAVVWSRTYCVGFGLLFAVAQITELRAFGDLIAYAVVGILCYLQDRGLLPQSRSSRRPAPDSASADSERARSATARAEPGPQGAYRA